ncbi:MAG: 4Fe-4S dicluster domain-containing protein [Armatimonadetes bacterium]|nr:4Fe-4S dicluster domain-containing protein [Armatimonadota bacterium]
MKPESPASDDTQRMAILTDTTRCTGCEACVQACKRENNLGRDRAWTWQQEIDSLSATRFCTVVRRPGRHFVRQQCRHCLDPACVSACLVGALQKTDKGAVIYDSSLCMGCRYCMMSCPFGIPRYEWDSAAPWVRKCVLCYGTRLKQGRQPACTEACPEQATIFGTRAELLAEARRRIAAHPGRYYPADRPRIWGETEVGGTGVLYISNISLDFLGWAPELGDQPVPHLTWAVMEEVPPLALGVVGVMSGIYWFFGRRNRVRAAAARAAETAEPRKD